MSYAEQAAVIPNLIAERDDLKAKLSRAEAQRNAYADLAKGQERLLAAYRLGRQPSESTFQILEKARAALKLAGVET